MILFGRMILASLVLLSTSVGFSKTLTCQGKNADGSDVVFSQTPTANNQVTVSFENTQDGKSLYKNQWTSDDAKLTDTETEYSSSVSMGSRAEYFAELDLQKIDAANLTGIFTYEENDSGWEYSAAVSNILCEEK